MKKLVAILCAVVIAALAVIGVTNLRSSNRIKALNEDITAMQDAVNASRKNAEELADTVSAKESEIKTLTEDVTAKQAEIETLTADVADKQEQIAVLTADVADKTAQITALTAKVDASAAEITALNEQTAAAQAQIDTLNEQAAAAQAQIDALVTESAEKNAQIEQLSTSLTAAEERQQQILDTLQSIIDGNYGTQQKDEGAGLPQVGDTVQGFVAREIRDFPMIGAKVVLFEHEQTGARLTYIANSDTNRAFQLTFLTRPLDNTGLPHVFEHACTAGSEKYPSASLWFDLLYQTYNTYFNAYTTDAMTCYPLASLSEAQLLKYADYYTDSCLHPMILQDESIYRTEAWRYRMASPEDDLTLEGTVYSEMLGAYTLERAATLNANRAAFPGASIGFDYGGEPDAIPDMTWEMLKEYHGRFYHPSNCMAYLYGQFEDYTAFLALLNEAFAGYEKADLRYEEADYTPIAEPAVDQIAYPAAEGSDTANHSAVVYYIVCPGMRQDTAQEQVIDNLCSLLSQEGSALMQSLRAALPAGQFSVGREVAAPDDGIIFVANSVNAEDAELFKNTVDEALRQTAKDGFSQEMVDSVMTTLELSNKLAAESSDPVESVLESFAYTYAVTGDPFGYLDTIDSVEKLDEMNAQGLYAQAISDWLLDKQTWTLTTTYPQPGLREAQDEALAQRLAAVKEAMTEEEKQAVIDATNAPAKEDDDTALVAQLQAVTVASLPEEIHAYEISDETDENGIRRINVTAALDGVGRANIYLDISGLPQEDILWAKLMTDLVGQLDTDQHTKEELDVLSARYLYNGGINLTALEREGQAVPLFRMGWTALDGDLAAGYDLVREMAFGTKFDDLQKLQEKITTIKTSVRAAINGAPQQVALYRAAATYSNYARYISYINFLDYYQFLVEIEEAASQQPEAVAARLQAVQDSLNNSYHATLTYVGSADSIAVNQPLADAFAASLNSRAFEAVAYDLPVPAVREAVILDSNVQQNVLAADFTALGLPGYDAGLDAVNSLVAAAFLTPQLRDQYGVYTPVASAADGLGEYLLAYRDPNIAETYAVYETLADQLSALSIDQDTLDGYILSAYSALAKGSGELTGGLNAMTRALEAKPQDIALTYMRQLKTVTPERVKELADLYAKLAASGARVTVGSAAAINAQEGMFDAVLNPFGTKDNTQVELTDITEGDAYYDAVRYVFENSLMEAAAEDAFGVNDEATVGEWAVVLVKLLGGSGTPEESIAMLSQIGLMRADADPAAALTRAALISSCETLCQLAQVPPMDTTLPESASENATRGDIALLAARLDQME